MQLKAILVGLLSASGALAASSSSSPGGTLNARDDKSKGLAKGATLRIMALGASITWGDGADKTGGYRKQVVDELSKGGNKVEMVGSRKNGDFAQNQNEGWGGMRIDEVRKKTMSSVAKLKPGIVLLNVGTNDAVQNRDVAKAGQRYEALIKDILKRSPRAVVIASTLIHNRKDDVEKRVKDINEQYKRVVNKMQKEKKRVVLVDMAGSDGPQTKKEADEYHDDTHPNDKGYKKMADLWVKAIREADRRGLLRAPSKIKQAVSKSKKAASKPKKAVSKARSKLLDDIRKIIQDEFNKFEKKIKDLKDKKKN